MRQHRRRGEERVEGGMKVKIMREQGGSGRLFVHFFKSSLSVCLLFMHLSNGSTVQSYM